MNATEKWGLPDWKNSDAYPGAEDLTDREWWWEFTRRRPDYRALWESSEKNDWQYDTVLAADVDWLRVNFEMSRLFDPTKSYSEWVLSQNYWPCNGSFGPSNDPFASSESTDDELAAYGKILREHQIQLAENAGYINYRFKLNEPLGPQLKRAEQHLATIQDELYGPTPTARYRRDKWPLFLRCLDGRDTGATYQEIADVFWPSFDKTPQSARDLHKSASQLRDSLRV